KFHLSSYRLRQFSEFHLIKEEVSDLSERYAHAKLNSRRPFQTITVFPNFKAGSEVTIEPQTYTARQRCNPLHPARVPHHRFPRIPSHQPLQREPWFG